MNKVYNTQEDMAKNLKDNFSLIQAESVVKRIRRLFNKNLSFGKNNS